MTTRIPVTTLSNFRQNFVPPRLQDLLYIQQGSEYDRDSAGTLGQFLESQVIQSFLNDRDNWRTFTPSEAGIITLGDYQRNVIIVPSVKDQALGLDHFPTNGLIIYAPDWDAENSVTAINISEINDINRRFTITKGGVGVFYSFGPDQPIIGQSLIGSSALSLAVLKKLITDKLIVESELTLPALSILSEYIATGAVTSNKIGPGAVINSKIAIGAVHEENIDTAAVTTGKLANYAVETDKIKDKAVDSFKLADQLSFVKTPKFPKKIYTPTVVTESADFDVNPNSDGAIFSTAGGYIITQKMHFSDADSRFQAGDTYRIYNETPNGINVIDWSTGNIFTAIVAWTFKDFYYNGNAWELA